MKLTRVSAVGAIFLALTVSLPAATLPPGKTQQLTSLDEVPEGLAKSDWQSIRAAYEAGRHAFQPVEGGWQARNPGQQWTTKFDGRGFVAQPRDGGWTWGLELKGYGFPGAERAVGGVPAVKADGQRLTYGWDAAVQEWWVNDQRGLEHGFTVQERPAGAAEAPLQFDLAVRGSLAPQVAADGLGVNFRDGAGATVLTYAGLKVWDADGKILASRFVPVPSGVRLLVEERGARYPLTIDPVAQQAYLKTEFIFPPNVVTSDNFGHAVAVSGDTVVIGAWRDDSSTTGVNSVPDEAASDAGAVYVFVRSGGTWSQQAYLKPAAVGSTQAGDNFGVSVAISGDTLVVGALWEGSSSTGVNSVPNEAAPQAGAAYIFVRSGGAWSQQAYLKPAAVGTSQATDWFGYSVAISADTVVVGAYLENSSTTGVNSAPNESATDSGAAYVFVRSGTTWTQQAYLKPAAVGTSQVGDNFGVSVGIWGDTVVVGAWTEDSSTLGVNSAPNDSGSNFNAGAAYVFFRSGTTWTQQAYLKPALVGTGQADDRFGISAAISGNTLVVGAINEDSTTTGVNSAPNESPAPIADCGAAYIFVRNGTTWTQEAYLKPAAVGTSQLGDNFGWSVAISGDTVAVGAPHEDSNTTGVDSAPNESADGAGAAYVFTRSGTTWTQQAYLKPAAVGSTQMSDRFGIAVAVSGSTVLVGADLESSSSTGVNSSPDDFGSNSGAGYVFLISSPIPVSFVNPSGGPTAGGTSVAIYGFGYTGATGVTFGGTAASFTVVSDTKIIATAPAHSAGVVNVVVTTPLYTGTGTGLFTYANVSNTADTDGDGLNDAAEFQLAAQGFNYQSAQPALVNTFLSSNALFTQSLYDANRTAGRNDVLNSPNTYSLYSLSQVQALNVGTPLIAKDAAGKFKLTIGVKKSTNLLTVPFSPFPMNGAGMTTTINAAGKLDFVFPATDNAAFFRIVDRPPQPLGFSSAVADFQQGAPFVIANSLLPGVEGWGVFGGVQAVRTGYFKLSAPAFGDVLEIAMLQNFGESAWIQLFEIAVTTDPVPNTAGGGNWTTWVPTVLNSSSTALSVFSGTKILSTGTAATATYTVRGNFPMQGITGVRLTITPHDQDPLDGFQPTVGRSANGNFVLSEIKATADPF